VQQTDVGISADNLLAIQLQNQTKHTVSSRMLRTEVDGVMANLATLDALSLGFKASGLVRGRGTGLVGQGSEHRVGRNESCSLIARGFRILARKCGRN
jgi:hypothetical protein